MIRSAATTSVPTKGTPLGKLPSSIFVIGLVSMLNDIATDMVVPIIPILLATTLSAGPVVLGLVEGVSDAVAAFLRLWAGRHSDMRGGRRKPLVIVGYTISNLARSLLGLATVWWHVIFLRSIDRVGKGIRSAPRDALIVDIAPPLLRGKAFGVHRGLDNAGAVLGALIAALIVYLFSANLSQMLLISAIPGVLAIFVLAWGVAEPRAARQAKQPELAPLRWRNVLPPMQRYLLVVMLFGFARLAETFIVLRAHELGASLIMALLLWAAVNAVKVVSNYWGGVQADRMGKLNFIIPGWLLHCVALGGLSLAADLSLLWATALFFGLAMGATEGVERAVLGDLAPESERGTAYGWYYALAGLAAIPAGALFGAVWQFKGAQAAFAMSSLFGIASLLFLRLWAMPLLQPLSHPKRHR